MINWRILASLDRGLPKPTPNELSQNDFLTGLELIVLEAFPWEYLDVAKGKVARWRRSAGPPGTSLCLPLAASGPAVDSAAPGPLWSPRTVALEVREQ